MIDKSIAHIFARLTNRFTKIIVKEQALCGKDSILIHTNFGICFWAGFTKLKPAICNQKTRQLLFNVENGICFNYNIERTRLSIQIDNFFLQLY